MMKYVLGLAIIFVLGCAQIEKVETPVQATSTFPGMKGCFLLYNVKQAKLEKMLGGTDCTDRLPACSSFKVPLAVMAFDSGVLKNERQVLKWDGRQDMRPEVNRDHNAKTWMRDSVVWFSQRLTLKMGTEKVGHYLKSFHYGNEDISGGLTEAWLVSPASNQPALQISADEQLEFMKKLWADELPVSKRAMKLTRDITYLETSPRGFSLHGKTGSNFYNAERTQHLGWFIGRVAKGEAEYLVVTNIRDLEPTAISGYGGARAKQLTKDLLLANGLW